MSPIGKAKEKSITYLGNRIILTNDQVITSTGESMRWEY